MRLLFCSRPAFGHVYPLMPLAVAARDAGHDVRFATAGDFVGRLRRLGFTTYHAGPTFDDAFALLARTGHERLPKNDDGRPNLEIAGQLFVDLLGRGTAAELAPLLPDIAPDLVVYEHGDIGAAVAAKAAGIPTVCHLLSPFMPADVVAQIAGDRIQRLTADYGLAADVVDWYSTDGFIDIFPDAVQLSSAIRRPDRIRLRPAPFTEPGVGVPDWVGRTERPLVYLTLGTVVAGDDVLAPAISALAGLDADVLVTLGSAAGTDLGPLPANVHVEPFVDQSAVLRHAALAVHHGGSGTMLDALAKAVPQVVLPKGADQFLNGDLLRTGGIATVLEPHQATAEAIAEAAASAIGRLSPAAAAVRDDIAAMPGTGEALEALSSLVAATPTPAVSRA